MKEISKTFTDLSDKCLLEKWKYQNPNEFEQQDLVKNS